LPKTSQLSLSKKMENGSMQRIVTLHHPNNVL